MANRKLPFGYCMESGQICVVDDETEIIRMIFTSYAEGNSYETLAEWLNNGRHPYAPGKRWNKNTLARILQDERYLGNSVYPAILASGAFQRRKPTASGKLNHPQIKDIRILARCAACGKPIQRERTDTWRCPHCMTLAINSTDKRLMDADTIHIGQDGAERWIRHRAAPSNYLCHPDLTHWGGQPEVEKRTNYEEE